MNQCTKTINMHAVAMAPVILLLNTMMISHVYHFYIASIPPFNHDNNIPYVQNNRHLLEQALIRTGII